MKQGLGYNWALERPGTREIAMQENGAYGACAVSLKWLLMDIGQCCEEAGPIWNNPASFSIHIV